MGPVIERVPQGFRYGFCPGMELLQIRRISGDVELVDTICPHGSPFVMIAIQPDSGKVVEFTIVGNFGHWQVTVVVENRHIGSKFMVQPFRALCLQQKVIRKKRLHGVPPF